MQLGCWTEVQGSVYDNPTSFPPPAQGKLEAEYDNAQFLMASGDKAKEAIRRTIGQVRGNLHVHVYFQVMHDLNVDTVPVATSPRYFKGRA